LLAEHIAQDIMATILVCAAEGGQKFSSSFRNRNQAELPTFGFDYASKRPRYVFE